MADSLKVDAFCLYCACRINGMRCQELEGISFMGEMAVGMERGALEAGHNFASHVGPPTCPHWSTLQASEDKCRQQICPKDQVLKSRGMESST